MEEQDDICHAYAAQATRRRLFLLVMLALLLLAVLASVAYGASVMSLVDVLRALFAQGGQQHDILWALRVPRVAIAALVGFGLGFSGTVFQAVLRNRSQRRRQVCRSQLALGEAGRVQAGAGIHVTAPPTTSA